MWIWQAISGALLIILMAVHMIAHHFVVEGGLRSYSDVVAYISNPWIFTLETLFLFVVTTHAMMGLRAVALDLGIGRRSERLVNGGLILAGLSIMGYSIWLTATIVSRG